MLVSILAAAALAVAAGPPPAADDPFAGWAAVVVSGDDHAAHQDVATAAFDNARRDVARGFEARGLRPGNLAEISVLDDKLGHSEFTAVREALLQRTRGAPAGCLVYFTSHGSPEGVLVADDIVPPPALARLVREACPDRPTAVIVSACYSGVFVPALTAALGPREFVMTAARRDRSSFGCSESDRYPFFDGCLIEALPRAAGFADLADRTRRCVAEREDAEGMRPRSQPQLAIGSEFVREVPPFPPAAP